MQIEAGQEFIAVSVKFLDGKAAESIAHYARLEGLHFAPSKGEDERAQVPVLSDDGGTIGYLVWPPILPGFMNGKLRQILIRTTVNCAQSLFDRKKIGRPPNN